MKTEKKVDILYINVNEKIHLKFQNKLTKYQKSKWSYYE